MLFVPKDLRAQSLRFRPLAVCGKEFPEYQKILDGTWKKEQEEEKKRREEERKSLKCDVNVSTHRLVQEEAAPEIGGLGRGFGMVCF